jgi:uncharacterized protein
MKEPAIVDSTCFIAFDLIDHLNLLPSLFDPVIIPPAVAREFGGQPPWVHVLEPQEPTLTAALRLMLDEGESEVIALACQLPHRPVLDDLRAREVAQRMGLKPIGTVGLLVRAKRAALIAEVKPLLFQLNRKGFYLSDALKKEVLLLAGE